VVAVGDGLDAQAELVRDRFERALAERGREGEVWHLDLPEV